MKKLYFIALILAISNLRADDPSFKFEGLLGNVVQQIQNMNSLAQPFIPYNPVIIEIGAYEGAGTFGLGARNPHGTVFAFEPHPKAYAHLVEKVKSLKNVSVMNLAVASQNGVAELFGDGEKASLVFQNQRSSLQVPTVRLDDWCRDCGIDHVDFLRLDVGGFEWQILKSSPKILKEVIVIVTKTYLQPSNKSILPYSVLKEKLEHEGFELLSHWYQEKQEGEATFIKKYMYDSLFR